MVQIFKEIFQVLLSFNNLKFDMYIEWKNRLLEKKEKEKEKERKKAPNDLMKTELVLSEFIDTVCKCHIVNWIAV